MYIPNTNLLTDSAEIIDFIKRFSFGTIITSINNIPTATHLPFLVEIRNDKVVLISHFAKANDQWRNIYDNLNLVIFQEPHAYISPSHYEKTLNVPTWNYIAVHAYGKGQLVTEQERVMKILEKTILKYEEAYQKQWESLPEDYKFKMANGIVAFEIEVTDLQAKQKLSQNKTAEEQANIINSLSKSSHSSEQLIAEYMRKVSY